MTLDDLYSEFDQREDWEEHCDYLIELGFELPAMSPEDKIEENRIQRCKNEAWIAAKTNTATAGEMPRIYFSASSDSKIVNGLIAVVMIMYNGKTAREILELDSRIVFKKLGLDKQLLPVRKNGLSEIVQRIRHIAAESLAKA